MLILLIALIVIILVMICFIIAFFLKEDVIYKVQIATVFNTLVILFIAVYVYYINKPHYIDIAILYAVLSFGGILAVSKFLKNNIKNNQK
jgi:multisubunit Na+/H+ antiporter MnhF subunit